MFGLCINGCKVSLPFVHLTSVNYMTNLTKKQMFTYTRDLDEEKFESPFSSEVSFFFRDDGALVN